MCFLLGNDFLPHFPGLNIRTHANHTLLEFYRIHIGAYPDRFLVSISPPTINWNWVKLFISKLALGERTKIAEELVEREKMEKRVLSTSKTATEEDRKQTFENTPILYRGEERYIAPNEMGWESRYYERAFGSALNSSEIQRVCMNYLQGLEWVFRYYIEGCCDWRWKYDGHYAPLLADLVSHIPNKTISLLRPSTKGAFHPNTQLLYVIPPWNHDEVFGTSNYRIQKIKKVSAGLFREKSELAFQWMFCRYFWESHAKLPEVDLRTMETWNEEFVPKSKKSVSR
jgi:5'-3' exoribonuclease 2